MAKCVWALAPDDITDLIANIEEPHAKPWLAAMIEALPHEELTRVYVTMWALWHARRKAIHEGIFQSPLSTHLFTERFLSDLQLLASAPVEKKPKVLGGPRWIPPPRGFSKINVDAVISKNSAVDTFAAEARGEDGGFLGASSIVMEGITDSETLEEMACREGMALAADLLLRQF
jgi:hypothetical protein